MSVRLVSLLALGCLVSCASPGPETQVLTADGETGGWWSVVGPRLQQGALSFRRDQGFNRDESGLRADTIDGMVARVSARGMRLHVTGDVFGFETLAFGRESKLYTVESALPIEGDCLESGELEPSGDCARRVELPHAGLTEWWANRKLGAQQGWDVEAPPEGEGMLVLALGLSGGAVDLDADGLAAWITGENGTLLRYGDLFAWDADGQPLDAAFSLEGEQLLVLVDDTGARYPLVIDPIATTASTSLTGPSSTSQFGFSVAGAGDVNNDGYDDVIIGAPGYSSSSGRAYVYHGSRTGVSSSASRTLSGSVSAYFGYSVDGAGDVNKDGYDDVIVGAPGVSTLKGAAYVYHGSSSGVSGTVSTTLSGSTSNDQFGFAVAGAGDVNNDGYNDVIVGANNAGSGAGRVTIHHGSSSGISSSAARTINGTSPYYLGEAVSGAGDVDGDGYDDVVIGAPGYSSGTGRAYVYEGSSSGIGSTAATTLTGGSTSA